VSLVLFGVAHCPARLAPSFSLFHSLAARDPHVSHVLGSLVDVLSPDVSCLGLHRYVVYKAVVRRLVYVTMDQLPIFQLSNL
jgi:hypothetical protein